MSETKKQNPGKKYIVGQAILWATALLGSSYLLKGTEQGEHVFMLLFVLAASSTLLNGSSASDRCLWRKLTGRSQKSPEA
ncbi:MAG: hypothetical protein HWE08_07525 [Alphaproteobacteria bacterium]|nr:hypothetical protein [Alphaproteobacteria bacterium]